VGEALVSLSRGIPLPAAARQLTQFGLWHTIARRKLEHREGELAKVAQITANQGGDIASCGVFMAQDPTKWGLVLKVRNVDSQILAGALSQIEGANILDVREA
jgi:hypothetical protein